jgi:hypothetical protein
VSDDDEATLATVGRESSRVGEVDAARRGGYLSVHRLKIEAMSEAAGDRCSSLACPSRTTASNFAGAVDEPIDAPE